MSEQIYNILISTIRNKIEDRIDTWLDNNQETDCCGNPAPTTRQDAIEHICEDMLDYADEMGLYDVFEYILHDEYGIFCNPKNPVKQALEPKKSEAQTAFENMMGLNDLSSLLNIRG